jgi:hypothetical protein
MIFDFYTIEAGAQGVPELNKLEAATVDAFSREAVERVTARFSELVGSNPGIDNIVVIAPSLGASGAIVASEHVHGQPRRGRFLTWTADIPND